MIYVKNCDFIKAKIICEMYQLLLNYKWKEESSNQVIHYKMIDVMNEAYSVYYKQSIEWVNQYINKLKY